MVSTRSVEVTSGLVYSEADGLPLHADLYRPDSDGPVPVVVYVHGGGFEVGSRSDRARERLVPFATHSVAVLSVDYRLAPAAHFPAPLHDVRNAIRWIRNNGSDHGLDTTRIGIWGASAGALLSAVAALQPEVNELGDASVQAAALWFGVYDVAAAGARSWLEAAVLPSSFEKALLGAQTPQSDLAREASAIESVSADAPPILLAHGDRDQMVSIAQSADLHRALVRAGGRTTFVTVGGAGHEDVRFETPAHLAMTAAFFETELTQPM